MNNAPRKICTYCGNYLAPDQAVCPNCGEVSTKAIPFSDTTQAPYTVSRPPYTTTQAHTTVIPSYTRTQAGLNRQRQPFDTVQDPVTAMKYPKNNTPFTGPSQPTFSYPNPSYTASSYSSPYMGSNASVGAKPQSDNTAKIIIGCVTAFIVLIIIIVAFSDIFDSLKGPNLSTIYTEHCEPEWADLEDGGDCLKIDSNPNDTYDSPFVYIDAYDAVEKINEDLGIPSYVWKDMERTRGVDGRQSERFEDLGITVSWSYHPNTGFEVTYRKIK